MRTWAAAVAVVLCAGCASGPPDWVAEPAVDGGFAATDCVRDSGKLSLDRQVALAKARAGVARQFDQRVSAMDRAYARMKAPEGAEAPPGAATPFAIASKVVAEQMLGGLPPMRVEYVEVDDVRSLCAMVTLESGQMRPVFDRLVQASGEAPDEATREVLYREFTGTAEQD